MSGNWAPRRDEAVPGLPRLTVDDYLQGLLVRDRGVLARAITLIESSRPDDQRMARELVNRVLPHTGKSLRIGMTGMPGAGKSALIDSFGSFLTAHSHRVAVLSIDPSSARSGGSLLGDETRMVRLSTDPNAFIRPSPSGLLLGGVARQTVSDNLKAGITKACFHEPTVNRTYADLARHYGTAIVPARPYKPRDKAKVEVGVQVVGRWILARLRHRRFFSLAELNAAIRGLLDELNNRVMRGWGTSRRALFEQLINPRSGHCRRWLTSMPSGSAAASAKRAWRANRSPRRCYSRQPRPAAAGPRSACGRDRV